MVKGIWKSAPSELNKVFDAKFCVDSRVQYETPEEGRRMHRSKRCEYNNEVEDHNSYTLSDKNDRGSSQKTKINV